MLSQNPRIILKSGDGDVVFELHEGQVLFAGRTAECDICLPTPAVSRRHAIMVMRGGKCGLKDMGSGNGTFLNGVRLDNPVKLRDGDVIQIASHRLEFVVPPKPARFATAGETVLMPADVLQRRLEGGVDEEASTAALDREPPEAVWPPPSAARSARLRQAPEQEPASEISADALSEKLSIQQPEPEAPVRQRIDENTVRRVRESIRLTPKAPPAPKVELEAVEDEIDDGTSDTGEWEATHHDDEPEHEEHPLSPLLGDEEVAADFTPEAQAVSDLIDVKETLDADDDDEPEPPPPFQEAMSAGAGADEPESEFAEDQNAFVNEAANSYLPLPPEEANPDGIPVGPVFREAIESRLFYYSFMEDLRVEREEILAHSSEVTDAVRSEIDRQNREMAKPPNADQASDRIEKVNARRETLRQKVREAKENGTPMPPRPSRLMRDVEDIGINQWTIISQSLREALPAAFEAGYELVRKEPLGRILEEAGIDAKTLLGGSAYILALEELLAEAKFNRAVVKEKISELPKPDAKKSGGGGGMLSMLGRKAEPSEEDEGDDGVYESLVQDEQQLALRDKWISQEMTFVEEMLIKEFWRVYQDTALKFIPDHRGMEVGVRAFLRYGVIGFSRWWLKEDVRAFVLDDCMNEVRHEFEVGAKITNVVYADEYLAAVLEWRCTPAMDENLEINEKNSPNWKADKALRRLISSRAQITRTNELIDELQGRLDNLDKESAVFDERIKALLPGSKNFKQAKQELSQDRQAVRIEISKIKKLADKLRESVSGDLAETVVEVEKRFADNEIPRPAPEFMIEREVGQVRRIGRLTANLKERLLPLAMRDYQLNTDAANDRLAIIGELADIERRDPRIFLETLVPSKKKANRVDMRISPVIVLVPSAGILAFSWNPRQKPEDGRLALPTFFIRQRIRERQITYLMSDFRWDTAKASAGMDLMNSETIVAEFMRVRWDWRKRSKEMREKGLIYTEQNDRTNWRRVYEAYLTTAFDGGKKLYNRNYDFYERVIGKYFDLPEGVELLRK